MAAKHVRHHATNVTRDQIFLLPAAFDYLLSGQANPLNYRYIARAALKKH